MSLWIGANFLPCAEVTEASRYAPLKVDHIRGFRLTIYGWLGPLGLSFAWYANVLLFICLIQALRGRLGWRTPAVAAALAATALLPHVLYSEVDGWHRAYFIGPALWVWLCSFAAVLGAGLLSRKQTME